MDISKLNTTAVNMVASGKGILAADESSGTIKKRFDSINVESTENNRRDYREMLLTTNGIEDYISGVILYDETIKQEGSNGVPLVKLIQDKGIIPGIKVDKSGHLLAGTASEQVTEGLDGLRDRLQEYGELGARFTKWRAIYTIGDGIPSRYCSEANAHGLARFAALSQEAGLVPMVEPEILMDGTHDIGRCFEETESALREMYYQLGTHKVILEGTILKTNMILSGKSALNRADPEEVAEKTVACLKRVVPAAVPGVAFLSGGQSDSEATLNLDSINRIANTMDAPWQLSFSYGRGLQSSPLKAWMGDIDNKSKVQDAFLHRASVTAAARRGEYDASMDM